MISLQQHAKICMFTNNKTINPPHLKHHNNGEWIQFFGDLLTTLDDGK